MKKNTPIFGFLMFALSIATPLISHATTTDTCEADIKKAVLADKYGKDGYSAEVKMIDRVEIHIPVEGGIEDGGERQVAYVKTLFDGGIMNQSIVFADVYKTTVVKNTTIQCHLEKIIPVDTR